MATVEKKNQAQFVIPATLQRRIDEVDLTMANSNVDLLLDFEQCTFITVDGLEWLEELLLRAASLNAAVNFQNVKPSIYKVFKVARIDSVLKACGGPAPSGPVC